MHFAPHNYSRYYNYYHSTMYISLSIYISTIITSIYHSLIILFLNHLFHKVPQVIIISKVLVPKHTKSISIKTQIIFLYQV